MHAQNKSLVEYGDLESKHHMDNTPDNEEAVIDDSPPHLVIAPGPGNLSIIKWSKPNGDIPHLCDGSWNHKGKAQEAIDGANHRIAVESNAAAKAADDLRIQEEADAAAIATAKEVAAENKRLEAESAKAVKDAATDETPVTKSVRKSTKK